MQGRLILPHILKRFAVTCSKAKRACIDRISFLSVLVEDFVMIINISNSFR